MRSELDVLLDKISDPTLRANIQAQLDRIRAKRTFGLVFESHLPERVRLPEHDIRVGLKVAYRDTATSPTFEVLALKKGTATIRKIRNPDGSVLSPTQAVEVGDERSDVGDLVVIADFGEPIYPGLRHLGSVERGGSKPAHVVIKGENHHVLEALQFTHTGKVDCIYIDPPYNTGARDWKYDNNYVDDGDDYRHSKWLAFMERRLLLAKELMNPEDSVLIVTIDEKEVNRLALMLDQLFEGCVRQTITTVISPGGTSRVANFSRVEEYILFVFRGKAEITRSHDSMLGDPPAVATSVSGLWEGMVRRGNGVVRAQRPGQFYPIYVDPKEGTIVDAGPPIALGMDRRTVPAREGLVSVWPIKPRGIEGFWQLGRDSLILAAKDGTAKAVQGRSPNAWTVKYMKDANAEAVRDGRIKTIGYEPNGDRILQIPDDFRKPVTPKTVWFRQSHDASVHGARLLNHLLPGRSFPFPKSLYAVEDAIRFVVKDKPNAVVLDFFGGSGTTTHAVARLNRQDGGQRQSILVTNNEVSAAEASSLRKKGLRPGDPEWEELGIFEQITRPRITAAVSGRTPEEKAISGDYRFGDVHPMADGFEENVEFFELTYLDPEVIELDLAFNAIAPLLWLRAGARGAVIDESVDAVGRRRPYAWSATYGVLFNPDRWRHFVRQCGESVSTVFIVTDSQTTFAGIASELRGSLDIVRLYENYLSTFAINRGYL
jgi:adenine-specific DNA-methyltransferase